MKALVVYDSVYGNTEQIAQAIGQALSSAGEVETLRVGDVTPERLAGLDVLVVGSPTQRFTALPSISNWLKGLPAGSLNGVKVAGFDTRVAMDENVPGILRFFAGLFGYAAEPIAKRLKQKGGGEAAPPAGFFVQGSEGPLKEGELERAADWAQQIIAPA